MIGRRRDGTAHWGNKGATKTRNERHASVSNCRQTGSDTEHTSLPKTRSLNRSSANKANCVRARGGYSEWHGMRWGEWRRQTPHKIKWIQGKHRCCNNKQLCTRVPCLDNTRLPCHGKITSNTHRCLGRRNGGKFNESPVTSRVRPTGFVFSQP